MISIRQADFDVAAEYSALRRGGSPEKTGAIVTFVGLVREFTGTGDQTSGLYLQHYPGMTERLLGEIVDEARQRWAVNQIRVIHRIGHLDPGDQIVFVGVSSAHRGEAFAAGQFVMDYLKTRATFWKKERLGDRELWVEARDSDVQAARRWMHGGN